MRLTTYHLRRDIAQSSTHCALAGISDAETPSSPLFRRVHAPPKVANLDLAIEAEEEVLGLEVAVNDILGMEVHEPASDLERVLRVSYYRLPSSSPSRFAAR